MISISYQAEISGGNYGRAQSMENSIVRDLHSEEKRAAAANGMLMLIVAILFTAAVVAGMMLYATSVDVPSPVHVVLLFVCLCVGSPLLFMGLRVLKPNEAYVLTIFGKYYGTLRGPGFFFVNPFAMPAAPAASDDGGHHAGQATGKSSSLAHLGLTGHSGTHRKKISLKTLTLSNDRQKINDLMGNPIEIGIVVIWRVVNTAKAVFNVDNYSEFLSIQCDSALRGIVRLYPYDIPGEEGERSLRGSSQEIADRLKAAIQEKVEVAGLEVMEARITHLAYAPEIAAAMLQRQQAAAIIDARAAIVKGAVGMVEMALAQLSEHNVVELDDERRAVMVSNLLVVLCGNRDAQPVVNSGSLY
jgi:regulator of protease activity HflC (stomatin/prohibitin superfamily)